MPIKETINYDIEKILLELGHNYSDFINFLSNSPTKQVDQLNGTNLNFTLEVVISEFTKSIKNEALIEVKSKNTTKYYLSFLQRFQLFVAKKHTDLLFHNLNEKVFHQFIEWINENNGSKLNQNSINTYLTIIRKICTFAYENEFAKKNLNYKFKKIKMRNLPRYFNTKQLKSFFYELKKNPNAYLWQTIFITLLGTGLRISELVNLKIQDINFQDKLIFTKGKGNKERYIPLYPEVEQAILGYLKTTCVTNRDIANGYLFSREFGTNRGMKISLTSVQYNFLKIARRLNFDDKLSVHSFRHTFAVNCLKADMKPAYLCLILGHTSPSSTYIYTQLFPKDLQKLVQDKFPIPFEKLIQQLLS